MRRVKLERLASDAAKESCYRSRVQRYLDIITAGILGYRMRHKNSVVQVLQYDMSISSQRRHPRSSTARGKRILLYVDIIMTDILGVARHRHPLGTGS